MNRFNIWTEFKNTIKNYNLINNEDRILIGISGGPDSVCLTYLLDKLKKKLFSDIVLFLCYVDHGIRTKYEIEKEVNLVKKIGVQLDIPAYIEKININKHTTNLEATLRKLRYAVFLKLSKKLKCNKIALGHTLNDQAETVLFNLLRSTNHEGITGIPITRPILKNIFIIRPLLKISRKEIEKELNHNKISFCMDKTNISFSYTRNYIRHKIIPLMEKINKNIYLHLSNLAEYSQLKEDYFNQLAEQKIKNVMKKNKNKLIFDLKKILKYNKYLKYKIFRKCLEENFKLNLYSDIIEKIFYMCNSNINNFIFNNIKIVKDKKNNNICIYKIN